MPGSILKSVLLSFLVDFEKMGQEFFETRLHQSYNVVSDSNDSSFFVSSR